MCDCSEPCENCTCDNTKTCACGRPNYSAWSMCPKCVVNSPTGIKFNQDKLKWSLLPIEALKAIISVFMYGEKKYSAWNWAKGIPSVDLYDAMQRHLTAWYSGEDIDSESRLHHLHHAGCNILMLITLMIIKPECDNRPNEVDND